MSSSVKALSTIASARGVSKLSFNASLTAPIAALGEKSCHYVSDRELDVVDKPRRANVVAGYVLPANSRMKNYLR